jgi:hypothetical protein
MKISFGVSQLSEERLLYAKQLGADGVTCTATVIPGYTENRVPHHIAQCNCQIIFEHIMASQNLDTKYPSK